MALTIRKDKDNKKKLAECTEEWYDDLHTILKSVNIIGDHVFYDTDLAEIEIPDNVEKIGSGSFENNKHLRKVKLGKAVKEIYEGCFAGCVELEEIILPEGLTAIGGQAFVRCEKLSKITIPSTVKYIGNGAFYDTKVETLSVPKNCIVENQGREINIVREGITKKDLIQRMIADYTQKQNDEHPNKDLDDNILDLLNKELKNCEIIETENKTTNKGFTQENICKATRLLK